MRLSDSEKKRISDLYNTNLDLKSIQLSEFYSRTKSLLDEQKSTLPPGPSQYSWSSGYAPKTSDIVNTDPSGAKVTIPSKVSKEEQERYLKNLQERSETLHDVLFYTSFVLGLIPHPITLAASVALDYADAGLYLSEGDYENAGLMATLATTGLIMIPVLNSAQKGLRTMRQANTLKNVGDKLKKGKDGLKTLTKSEMEALDALSDSKNLQAIYDGMNEYSKQQAQRYLSKPNLFKKGYTAQRFEKQGIRIRDLFYDDMAKRGVNNLIDMGVIGGMSLGEYAVSSQLIYPQYIEPMVAQSVEKKVEKLFQDIPQAEFEVEPEEQNKKIVSMATNERVLKDYEKLGNVQNLNQVGQYGQANKSRDVNLYKVLKTFTYGNTEFKANTIVGGF
jgi:hypothetical protein